MVRWRIEIRSRALLPSVSALVPAEQKGVYRSRKRTVVDARKEKRTFCSWMITNPYPFLLNIKFSGNFTSFRVGGVRSRGCDYIISYVLSQR